MWLLPLGAGKEINRTVSSTPAIHSLRSANSIAPASSPRFWLGGDRRVCMLLPTPGTECGAARGWGYPRSGCHLGGCWARRSRRSTAQGPGRAGRWPGSWSLHQPAQMGAARRARSTFPRLACSTLFLRVALTDRTHLCVVREPHGASNRRPVLLEPLHSLLESGPDSLALLRRRSWGRLRRSCGRSSCR